MPVAEYFKGKNVFITGGSGFLGKVLIEKLLRSCPGIGNVYILLRPKKGLSVETRLKLIKALPLFDLVRKEKPEVLNKIIPVSGDVCEINLGMSDKDRSTLRENVNVIYHAAASVRFDDFLKYAIIMNVRGTREVAKLALDLKHISLFVHISTTYCNADKLLVEEKLYPPHVDWRDAIGLAEESNEDLLNFLTEKYIRPMPNTYTFAKSLGEHVVNDLCKGKIATVIVRPSVVINTMEEPIIGWNDNFNGPVGLIVAGGKGLVRTILGRRDAQIDYMPVDYVIKCLLLITNIAFKDCLEEVKVFNISQNNMTKFTQEELIQTGMQLCQHSPFSILLWYPRSTLTQCWYSYYIQVMLFHMLPAFFVDIITKMLGKKPILVRLQRKIYIANTILRPFIINTFCFNNDKIFDTLQTLNEEDCEFSFKTDPPNKQEIFDYLRISKIGTAIYLLHEQFDIEGTESKKRLKKYWYADILVKTIFFGCLIWITIFKMKILERCYKNLETYIEELN